ncbi:MAG: hypothetical protein GY851_25285 [bacterium]|nr:hypothetical protein [bacterium]
MGFFRMLYAFIVFGGLSIILGLRSLHAAWQVAVTLTFFHTVLDYLRDMNDVERFGYTMPVTVQVVLLIASTLAMGAWVYRLQRGANPIVHLYLVVLWACYAIATVRSFFHKDLFFPPEGESVLSTLLTKYPSVIFVHGTFTVSAIVTTAFIVRFYGSASRNPAKS